MFNKATFDFLDELSAHNNKAWFESNKPRYEALVREPALDDLKRKGYVAMAPLTMAEGTGKGLVKLAGKRFAETVPFMRFLCDALEVPY